MFSLAITMDYSEMTLEEVLRTYSSVKGHRTRSEREINSLFELFIRAYYDAGSIGSLQCTQQQAYLNTVSYTHLTLPTTPYV